jgi:hypothetical protein
MINYSAPVEMKPIQRDLPHIWIGYILVICSAAFEVAEHCISPSIDFAGAG